MPYLHLKILFTFLSNMLIGFVAKDAKCYILDRKIYMLDILWLPRGGNGRCQPNLMMREARAGAWEQLPT